MEPSLFGFPLVTLLEAVDATSGVDELLLTGEERVALRADFDRKVVLHRGAGFKFAATGA